MERKTKISVIVPVYNLQEQLPRCLDSILTQTYDDVEIIVVDDGSKDNSRNIIGEYAKKDSRIISIFQENGGVTSARLTGIKQATGDYIGFVDGDDVIESDIYSLLLSNALKYDADISHCGYQMVFDDGRVNYFYNTGMVIEQDRLKGIKDLLEGTFVEPGLCNKLFRKELFYELLYGNVMDNSIKINEDLLMNFYLFSVAKRSVFQDVCKYHYIVRKSSASRQNLNEHRIFDPIKVKKIIYEQCDEGVKVTAESALLNTSIYVYCGLAAEGIGKYEKEKVYVRDVISKHYVCKENLARSTKILAVGIVKLPRLFGFFYPLYVKHLQKSRYE